jgi:hypothetical protein
MAEPRPEQPAIFAGERGVTSYNPFCHLTTHHLYVACVLV